MVGLSTGKFRCVLLTPEGKLLDCRAGSVVLPGHDGMIGLLRNHAPMLCKLGWGIVEVKEIIDRMDAYFLVNGGFVRISENYLTILANDVLTFDSMERDEAETLVSRAKSVLVGGAYVRQIEKMDPEKARMVVKLGRLAGV
ncbi:MAG: ATP synthase F1 subunit epsilon [Planctomycetes bacterium]|nr:ATP synthase F1 subunit epsilon [Planctomycetota bacterium]